MIRAYIDKDQTRWDKLLREFKLAYNSSYHTALKLSPYYLVHGHESRLAGKMSEVEFEDLDLDSSA